MIVGNQKKFERSLSFKLKYMHGRSWNGKIARSLVLDEQDSFLKNITAVIDDICDNVALLLMY